MFRRRAGDDRAGRRLAQEHLTWVSSPGLSTETTLIDATPPPTVIGKFYIVLLSPTGAVTFPISGSKRLVVGRSRRADIQLDDPLASRDHARLEASGENSILVVDLTSANGTRLKGQRIAPNVPQPVIPGDSIEIGNSVLLLQRHRAGMEQRRVWSHQYFEARLADACRRATGDASALAVLRVRFDALLSSAQVLPILLEECGENLLANYDPREYEVIVEGEAPEKLRDRLASKLALDGANARFGLAQFPRDGHSAHTLFDRASPRGRVEPFALVEPTISPQLDPGMAQAIAISKRIAPSSINVLLQGETGVGKELMSANIHRWSSRSGPLVCVNCAGLSENLLESDLFGHEKGAFTGASHKIGLLESAKGGTVLLDEIGELPLGLQAKLLRVLQEHKMRRVGGVKEIPLDVRFIAATNRDLEAETARGTFRQDLFFRLSAATVLIPPLRERRSEIAGLAHSFVADLNRELNPGHALSIADDALSALVRYAWPGNIRELKNVLERAVLLCSGARIELEHLPAEKLHAGAFDAPLRAHAASDTPPAGLSPVQAGERQRIIEALAQCAWNQTSAANLLGMPRRTLVSKLKAYQIPRPRGGRSAPGGGSPRP